MDKNISFIQQKKGMGDIDYLFTSVCGTTKHLTQHLQIKVQQQVIRVMLNAELEQEVSVSDQSSH